MCVRAAVLVGVWARVDVYAVGESWLGDFGVHRAATVRAVDHSYGEWVAKRVVGACDVWRCPRASCWPSCRRALGLTLACGNLGGPGRVGCHG